MLMLPWTSSDPSIFVMEHMPPDGEVVYRRNAAPKGPMSVFGYDYLADQFIATKLERPKLLDHTGLWGVGEEYAYETLNFVDGKRNAKEVRDRVTAEYGPVSLAMVVEYLKALEAVGVLERVPTQPPK
jgi:hypothetical protein